MMSFSKKILTPFSKERLFSTAMVTTIEEVNKSTKKLDDKKETVVTTPFPKNKLLRTEKVTTSEEVHKYTKIWMTRKKQWLRHHFQRKIIYN